MRMIVVTLAILLAGPVAAQQAAEVAFMRGVLNRLQPPSFEDEIEYCGFVFRNADGTIGATRASPGDSGGCTAWSAAPRGSVVIASYHTHGEFNRSYDSEFPSTGDLQADFADGIDGWISTPGGRLWFVDHRDREARLICDHGCMTTDPDYDSTDTGPMAWTYTIEGLRARY